MNERRSKLPLLVVDGVDVNESAHRLADQAIAEIEVLKVGAKRLVAVIECLFVCEDAGAQLPPELVDQILRGMDDLIVAWQTSVPRRGSS